MFLLILQSFHESKKTKKNNLLFQVHEYYAIIGRPRFGRSDIKIRNIPTDARLFNLLDTNGDGSISYEEFHYRLGE